ncbi:hypothetical protein FHX82_005945 [Amycolatopsis bartoniae]|uniref:DUF7847 domain-containing protein n=1 Tax=Amycolatopsis bartoniae TaxID=941986 RepID=A0A8H9J0D2_9PSEU|nr:hypothetical protein [Amycolatopsis bartoniae]MBB2938867.1 hypothetical protein [Amycolatopsis bartoniae]TVT00685.1 hypothetical protein FNH07_31175 [Amycolatopsis bartoniae]GHF77210.1 hypothetical protein GCM10017566_59260 [Amycolatopsis bartoniae]
MSEPGGWTNPDQPRSDLPPMPPPAQRPPGAGYGKPGVIPLRPLSVGEILDGAVTTMRRHPALVFGVSAVVAVVAGVLDFAVSYWAVGDISTVQQLGPAATQEEAMRWFGHLLGRLAASLGLSLLISLLIRTFLAGFITVVVGRAVLGRPVTFREALTELRPRLLPLLGLTVLVTIIVMIASVFLVIPGIWLWTLLSLAAPALVLEQSRIGESMRRSRRLVSGSWWRVFGILVLTAIAAWIISTIIEIPFGVGVGLSSDPTQAVNQSAGSLLLSSLGGVIAETIVGPFTAAATALLYIDQRMRKEGMDIQLARSAGTVQ